MVLTSVNSSAIRGVGHEGSTLAVLFHAGDTVYLHHGVPSSVSVGLMPASSMGAYYNQRIRGKFH